MTESAIGDVGIRHLSRYIFNCYLIEDGGDGAPLVVDVGIPSHAERVVSLLRDRVAAHGMTALATHAHSDHVAGLPALHDALDVRIQFPAKVRDYLAGDAPRKPAMREILKIAPVFFQQGMDMAAVREALSTIDVGFANGLFEFPSPIAGFVDHDDTVPGASDWQALRTPGHTDCSTCFYNARTKVLLSGDTILTYEGRAWFTPEITDAQRIRATEEMLRALDVEHILPGHGRPISGPDLMSKALSFRERPKGWLVETCRGWLRSR